MPLFLHSASVSFVAKLRATNWVILQKLATTHMNSAADYQDSLQSLQKNSEQKWVEHMQ